MKKKEGPKENSKDKKNNLDQDYVYLIKGDAMLEEKNQKKGKKKTSSEKIYQNNWNYKYLEKLNKFKFK